MKRFKELFCLAVIFALQAAPAMGQEAPPPDPSALAKQLSNPVASLISVPFQFNWDGGVGSDEDTRFLLNFQPVMPFPVGENWNLIARVIVPILSQPALVPGGQATFGMSDILFSAFFSPAKPGVAIWGVGPALQLPVSTDPFLGTEKWAAGPTFVVLKQAGPWTVGIGEPSVVIRRRRRPGGREPDVHPTVPGLCHAYWRHVQPEHRVQRELGGRERSGMDGADQFHCQQGPPPR